MSMLSMPRRRAVMIGGATLAGAALWQGQRDPAAAGEQPAPLAIELFTSQGCSSCPPADLHLGKLASRADIVALSFHVDYWDYIGWKDRFATQEMTGRQQIYARVLKQRYVYTPEMVVDGIAHEPGVKDAPIDALLADARRRLPERATPQIARAAGGTLSIALAPFKVSGGPADILVAVYDRRHSTPVHDGENNGRTLENFNVVRRFDEIAKWDGSSMHWTIPANHFRPDQGVAVLVQQAEQGQILGCNKFEPATS
jgi:hypothetical protein